MLWTIDSCTNEILIQEKDLYVNTTNVETDWCCGIPTWHD